MPPSTTIRTALSIILPVLALLAAGRGHAADAPAPSPDDAAKLYGPYKVVRLPITKGVRILNPIKISLGPGGRIFAANQTGEVYALRDSDGDGLEDEAVLYCDVGQQGLNSPGGFTFRGDTVFIGTRQEIRAYRDTDGDGKADTSWTFFKDFPHGAHPYEWTSGLCFGPDGWLYCALATDSWNSGASPDPKGYRGALLRISPDGKTSERVAAGLRSVWGMAFNRHGYLFSPTTKAAAIQRKNSTGSSRAVLRGTIQKNFRSAMSPCRPSLRP